VNISSILRSRLARIGLLLLVVIGSSSAVIGAVIDNKVLLGVGLALVGVADLVVGKLALEAVFAFMRAEQRLISLRRVVTDERAKHKLDTRLMALRTATRHQGRMIGALDQRVEEAAMRLDDVAAAVDAVRRELESLRPTRRHSTRPAAGLRELGLRDALDGLKRPSAIELAGDVQVPGSNDPGDGGSMTAKA
jgi:hypothetical protein